MLRSRLVLHGSILRRRLARRCPLATVATTTPSNTATGTTPTPAPANASNTTEIAKHLNQNDGALVDTNEEEEKKVPLSRDSVSKLFTFSKPEWPLIGASAATLLVTSSVTLLLPYASGQVIDLTMMSNGSDGDPITMAGGLFGLMTLSGGGVYLRSIWLSRAGNRIVARLRQQAYQQLLRQDVEYLETLSKGDFLSRLSADAQLVQSAVTTQAVAALRAVVMTTGSATMLLYTSPTLAAVSLCTLPPIFIGARFVGRQLQAEQVKVQELHATATSLAEQALSGIATVKQQYGGESFESHRYSLQISKAHSRALHTAHLQAQMEGLTHVAANGAVLGVLGYGGTLVLQGIMSAGDLTGFIMYSFLMAGNLSALSGIFADVSRSVAASDRVMEVLERESKVPISSTHAIGVEVKDNDNPLDTSREWTPPPITATSSEPLSVRIENLSFAYPSRPDAPPVLDGLNLSLESGKVLSLVGGSGSGKSTVASLLTRLYEVPRGTIYMNDVDLHDTPPEDLRQLIGIVSQSPVLFNGTIADNIRYGMWDTATDEEVHEAARLAHVLDFSDTFPLGLDTPINNTQLSGGQRQRVAIARTLLKNPPLIILDEATSALDARSEHLVQQAMNQIMASNKTVLSIAHRLSTIRHSDRIAVLKNGKVVEEGTFEELSSNIEGPFFRLMKTQLV